MVQEKATASLQPLGLYMHVPFCATSCDFCALYHEAPRREDLERYLDGMEAELARTDFDRAVDTVFWGGGTPGLLPAKDLERLGRAMLARLPAPPGEWTVEMAPSTVKADKLGVLNDLGVTRISMGVQSFQPEMLEQLGRMHSPRQVWNAIETIRAAGVANLNLDLIISCPAQSLQHLRADLADAVRAAPEHISTYCLTFEDDTALYARMLKGELKPKPEEEDAEFYETAWRGLAESGYAQYEISNHARPGFECVHNLNTWRMHEWIGIGPSASSQYRGRRWTNIHDIGAWLEGLSAGAPAITEEVPLAGDILAVDTIIFGLRMNAGVNLVELAHRFPAFSLDALEPLWASLRAEALLEARADALVLSAKGRLLADRIAVEVMDAAESPVA